MATGDEYRIKAADMNAKATGEASPQTRSELKKLVFAYLRLADHADRNANLAPLADPPKSPVPKSPVLQQQQPQSKIRTVGDDTE
jgi:hypothetical protein